MRPFTYSRATTLEDAVAGISPETEFLAGGTELLNWMRLGVANPDHLLDISYVDGLDGIETLADGGLRIGPMCRLNDVAADARVASDWPVLREAIHSAASAQLRNLATIGGNLLQKTRCTYFRSEDFDVACNRRRPGSGCSAVEGLSDRHAVFGWTPQCVATFPADPPVALAVLDAELVTMGPGGGRRIPITDLQNLPADSVEVDTTLERGEVIRAIEIPRPARRSAYLKVRERASYEYALVSAAVAVELGDDGTIGSARIALGSVAMRPWRLYELENRLVGLAPEEPTIGMAIDDSLADARPFGQSQYKVRLARNAVLRALLSITEKASS